jgi:hypothetical protein
MTVYEISRLTNAAKLLIAAKYFHLSYHLRPGFQVATKTDIRIAAEFSENEPVLTTYSVQISPFRGAHSDLRHSSRIAAI